MIAVDERVLRLVAGLLATIAVLVGAVAFRDAISLEGRPILALPIGAGGSVLPPVLVPVRFQAAVTGAATLDRVVAVNGAPWRSAAELRAEVARAGIGGSLELELETPLGERVTRRIPVITFDRTDLRQILVFPTLVDVGFFALTVAVVLLRPRDERAWAVFLFATGGSLNYVVLGIDAGWVHRFAPWSFIAGFVSAAALIHLAMLQPERRWLLARAPRGGPLFLYATAGVLWGLYVATNATRPRWSMLLDGIEVAAFTLGLVLHLANLILTLTRSPDVLRRQEARVLLLGPILYVPFGLLLAAQSFSWLDWQVPLPVYLIPPVVTAFCFGWAIFGTNLFELDGVIRRGIALGAVVLAAAILWLGLFVATQALLGPEAGWLAAVLGGGASILVLPRIAPLRQALERLIEGAFFPGQRAARDAVEQAARELPRLRGEADLAALLRITLARGLSCSDLRLVAGGPDEALRELGVDGGGGSTGGSAGDLVIPPTDALHVAIARGRRLQPEASPPAARKPGPGSAAPRQASELGAALVVPLPPSPRSIGALLLGPRRDGRLYTSDDQALIEALAAQASVAIENARAWEEVRRLEARLAAENVYLRAEVADETGAGEIIGDSPTIRRVRAQIAQVAPSEASVLVIGETGTGKELVVRALHRASRRADRVLVKLACAALPEALLESELFGHERGAFTGAAARKLGRLEVADGGTIFFDDVDTLPLGVQAKLLRAIQEGEIQRLGSNAVRRVNVRIVAATNRDLLTEVRAGRFREDLYYRLNVVPIELPPLRARPGDVRLLVEHIVRREAAGLGREIREISAEAMAELEAYPWPGNVRELRNVLERALVMSDEPVLRLSAPLLAAGRRSAPRSTGGSALAGADPDADAIELGTAPLAELVRRYKVRLVTAALDRAGGNHRAAAELLGMHRPSLTRMIGDLGLRSGSGAGESATAPAEPSSATPTLPRKARGATAG